jgi:hypothetical protein
MSHSTPVIRRPQRTWRAGPQPARTAAAITATAALALLAAACSGSGLSSAGAGGSPSAGGSTSSPSAIGYSRCMRHHGVPNFPDPGSNGQVPKASAQLLGVSSSQLQAAERACQHLYPSNGGSLNSASLQQCYETGDCPQALVQQALNVGRKFARCMRFHGVPNWPDPTIDSRGGPFFDINVAGDHSLAPGVASASPPVARGGQINTKIYECERLVPKSSLMPLPVP